MSISSNYVQIIQQELGVSSSQVQSVMRLLLDGGTVPFIARYRKEATGSLDEVAIIKIRDRYQQLADLDARKATVFKSIEDQGKLSDQLRQLIANAKTLSEVEDLYLPFKPKRRTKGTIAKEQGLEPLAEIIFKQEQNVDPQKEAQKYLDKERNITSIDEALQGARYIIAEWVNENRQAREILRKLFFDHGQYVSKVLKSKQQEAQKYKDYFDWKETVKNIASHRLLAIRRGEKEGFLIVHIDVDEEKVLPALQKIFIKKQMLQTSQIITAMEDAYKRLLAPSIETEVRLITKKQADEESIQVFADNVRQLLMASPAGAKNILAIDPGFRTGCKVVCLNVYGDLLENTAIFPFEGHKELESAQTLINLVKKYHIDLIAIGNGTASRETEAFIRQIKLPIKIPIILVNESGASIYSASEVAREEFPDEDITVRGAVSIGRRLQDPLAELVKIDPKSIGIGQYQHDVDQKKLKQSLTDVVMSCVNQVGVNVNAASKQLLTYVSGVGESLAKNIIEYRKDKGQITSREELKHIPNFCPKAFEQAAGFLRIDLSDNPLDQSAVHPESYAIVEQMAKDLNCDVQTLLQNSDLQQHIQMKNYVTEDIGLPTLEDIVQELAKPGRDPRDQFEIIEFDENVQNIEDLKPNMQLTGVVTNITNFGAFVDIGVHHDALIHISEISDKYIAHPSDVLNLQQKVDVKVKEVDLERKRIALTMKK